MSLLCFVNTIHASLEQMSFVIYRQLVVFQFDDHIAIWLHRHHKLKKMQIFLLPSLVVCLIAVLLLLWPFSPQSPIGASFRWGEYRWLSCFLSAGRRRFPLLPHPGHDGIQIGTIFSVIPSLLWLSLKRTLAFKKSQYITEQVSKCLLFSKTQ